MVVWGFWVCDGLLVVLVVLTFVFRVVFWFRVRIGCFWLFTLVILCVCGFLLGSVCDLVRYEVLVDCFGLVWGICGGGYILAVCVFLGVRLVLLFSLVLVFGFGVGDLRV